MRAAALPALLALAAAASFGSAAHVEVNDATFPFGACERVCIPAIVQPRLAEPGSLDADALVVGVALGGDARAYPIDILVWHEIVNDRLGEQAIAVSYCPLCGSAIVYDRAVAGQVLTFQTSGRLHRNDLVMLDDETRSLWPQLLGEAVSGPLHGERLRAFGAETTTWRAWREAHPASTVLARPLCSDWPYAVSGCSTSSNAAARNYGTDPYGGYALSRDIGISGRQSPDLRGLHPKAQVLGYIANGQAKAWPVETLALERVVNDEVGGEPVVLTATEGARLFRRAPGQVFEPVNATHMRDASGEPWELATGRAGNGSQLELLPAVSTFWFAWLDFNPGTALYGVAGVARSQPAEGGRVAPGEGLELRFTQAMVRTSVERGLRLEPPHPVNLSWLDDRTLRVAPREPWQAGRGYALSIGGAMAQDGLPMPPYTLNYRAAGGFFDRVEQVPGLGLTLWLGGLVALFAGAVWLARRWRREPGRGNGP